MSRPRKIDFEHEAPRFWDDGLTIEELIDSMDYFEPKHFTPKRAYLAHKRIDDLHEEKWLRRQISDWDSDETS